MKQAILAVSLLTAASAVQAQDYYLGGSADYALPHSGTSHMSVGLMGGAEFDTSGPLGFAAQGEYSAAASGSSKPDSMRLRGLASYDFGGFDGVAGLGATQYRDGGSTYNGYNFSVGVDVKLQSGPATVRVELIRDFMDHETSDDYGTNLTTTRIAYKYNF